MENQNNCKIDNFDEIQDLRQRLEEAEETLRAIREGEIDGLVVNGTQGEQIFTLVGADHSYRLLIEQMNEGALTLAVDGTILYCNRSFTAMIKANHQRLIGSSFFEVIHPINRATFKANLLRTEQIRSEITLLCSDSSLLPGHLSLSPMWVEGVKNFSLVITDLSDMKERTAELRSANEHLRKEIIERKRIEEKLLNSKKQKDYILNSITDAFFALNRKWQIVYWNKAAEKMFSLKKEKATGQNLWDVFPDFMGSEFYKQYKHAMNTNKPVIFETKGEYTGYWVEVRAYPSPQGLAIYLNNITKRKLALEELQSSEERFCKTFHSSPAMMAIIDHKTGCYLDVNESWLSKLGYCRDEVINLTSSELNIFPNSNQYKELIKEIYYSERFQNNSILLRTKTGEFIDCIGSSVVIKIGGEKCILSNLIDITDMKRMEKEINRLDRLNLIGEMAASIGHEIRNPMTSIRGFLQMMEIKEEYRNDKMFFDLMIEELDRANDIITNFLSMAKDKKVNLQLQYLDQVVQSLYPLVLADAIYQEKNVHLILDKPPMPLIDVNEIRQLILNLARNGLEAMSPGGILTIGTKVEEQEIVLFVKDQGSGLDSNVIDRLGTPFLTTKENGTGLGLAVCYSIAARHNARIDHATGCSGTTFYVRFPIPVEQSLLF